MNIIVIDASVAATWLFDDESDHYASAVLDSVGSADGVAPLLWQFEMRNILLTAKRRNRITQTEMLERLAGLAAIPLRLVGDADLDHAFSLASRHNLSFYDALYLELTLRLNAQLASLDAALVKAAKCEGVHYA